jgi:hypothetical protein
MHPQAPCIFTSRGTQHPAIAELASDRRTSLRDHWAIRLWANRGGASVKFKDMLASAPIISNAPSRLSFPFDQMNHGRTEHARFLHRCLQILASHE